MLRPIWKAPDTFRFLCGNLCKLVPQKAILKSCSSLRGYDVKHEDFCRGLVRSLGAFPTGPLHGQTSSTILMAAWLCGPSFHPRPIQGIAVLLNESTESHHSQMT